MDTFSIKITRRIFTEHETVGDLDLDGRFFCHTLEDRRRAPGVKLQNETAIPAGHYKVVMDYSNRFKHVMPHVLDVPGFTGIRIHAGNTDSDTSGCILVGFDHLEHAGRHRIEKSTAAFHELSGRITAAISRKRDVTLEITDEGEIQ